MAQENTRAKLTDCPGRMTYNASELAICIQVFVIRINRKMPLKLAASNPNAEW